MMSDDPSLGPMTRAELAEAIAAPAGKATEIIRKYDPQWGRRPGEKFDWVVKVRRSSRDEGTAIVKAASQEEADDLADELGDADIDWDHDDSFEIDSVEPAKPEKRR